MELAEEQSGWVWRIKRHRYKVQPPGAILAAVVCKQNVLKRLTDPRVFKLPDALLE